MIGFGDDLRGRAVVRVTRAKSVDGCVEGGSAHCSVVECWFDEPASRYEAIGPASWPTPTGGYASSFGISLVLFSFYAFFLFMKRFVG